MTTSAFLLESSPDIFLIEFATAADAHSYVISTELADSTAAGVTIKSAVPGVADGMAVGGTAVDKDGNTLVLAASGSTEIGGCASRGGALPLSRLSLASPT
jgi:hypothetical protein